MSFYIKPPRGLINCHKLEECVKARLLCYDNLIKNNTEQTNFQYLVEDSVLDRSGHYTIKLASFSNPVLSPTFFDAEIKLLEQRLSSYEPDDVRYFLKTLLRQCKDHLSDNINEKIQDFLRTLHLVCTQMLHKDYGNHVYGLFHLRTEYCDKYTLEVPFNHCRSLVSGRKVELRRGYARITCGLWKALLLSLFETFLIITLSEMKFNKKVQNALKDERISPILNLVSEHYYETFDENRSKISLTEINNESKYFPLCMQNLFEILRDEHRLPHEARFNFSLFLKDIGLSLNDSIKFWQEEYSKTGTHSSKCSHNWVENEKKYIYSIRHLYGLEGARTNYQMRSCCYLQEKIMGANEEGGCPFKHFDDDNLLKILKKNLPDSQDDHQVIIHKRKANYSGACKIYYDKIYLNCVNKNSVKKYSGKYSNPAQYYISFKDLFI